jgi:hypothetical protein
LVEGIDVLAHRSQEGKLYLFVAIDRTSKFVAAQLHEARSAHSTGLKTRSVTGRAPRNLVSGYRFSNAIEVEADLGGYIRAIEACLLLDEPAVELPTVESPPLISPDPFDIPRFLDRRAKCGVQAPAFIRRGDTTGWCRPGSGCSSRIDGAR